MKRLTFALLALVMVLSLTGCLSTEDTPQADATAPAATITDDRSVPDDSTIDEATDPKANTSTEDSTSNKPDDVLALGTKDENYPVQGSRKTHNTESVSIVASYLAGEWEADQPLWSEDYSTRVAVQADGSLIYTMNEHINFYNDSEILFARQLATYSYPSTQPIPPTWPGEKVYVDLPEQTLPEGTWVSSYVVGEGTFVQNQQGVTLYHRGEVVDTWEAEVKEQSFLATRTNCRIGTNFLLADDRLLELVPGGTTEVVYDHVVDAGHNTIPFLIVLTIEDGVLTEHYYWGNYGWKDIEIASDVAEARLGLGATIFRATDGMAFVVTPRVYYSDPKTSVACVGERTLDNLEGLWESFGDNYGPSNHPDIPDKLMAFLTKYSSAAIVISDPITSGDDCGPDDTTDLLEID